MSTKSFKRHSESLTHITQTQINSMYILCISLHFGSIQIAFAAFRRQSASISVDFERQCIARTSSLRENTHGSTSRIVKFCSNYFFFVQYSCIFISTLCSAASAYCVACVCVCMSVVCWKFCRFEILYSNYSRAGQLKIGSALDRVQPDNRRDAFYRSEYCNPEGWVSLLDFFLSQRNTALLYIFQLCFVR